MDSIAAYNGGSSPQCSCTILTARSRTSGENFLDVFMASSSQELKPLQNRRDSDAHASIGAGSVELRSV